LAVRSRRTKRSSSSLMKVIVCVVGINAIRSSSGSRLAHLSGGIILGHFEYSLQRGDSRDHSSFPGRQCSNPTGRTRSIRHRSASGQKTSSRNFRALRVDYRLNQKHSTYFRFFRDQASNIQPDGVTGRQIISRQIPQNGVVAIPVGRCVQSG